MFLIVFNENLERYFWNFQVGVTSVTGVLNVEIGKLYVDPTV